MRGALIITLSNLVSRILGSIYRPVAQLFIGDRGLALVSPPSAAYFIIMAISSIGLNVAVSRLVASRLAVSDYRGAWRVMKVAAGMLVASGLFFSIAMALSANWLSAAMGFPEAAPGFLVLSPAVFLVSLLCAFRGLYQGMQQMQPSAMSQVWEQTARVVIGLVLVAAFAGVSVHYGAAAFNAGHTVGVLVAVLYGGFYYLRHKPTEGWAHAAPVPDSIEHESTGKLLGKILSIALPLSLIGSILPLMQFIDSGIVTNRLMAIGVEEGPAKDALAYLMNAGTLRDLPTILTVALYVSLVPAITESASAGRLDQARYRAATAFRITFLVGIPATVGLMAGARDAYGVLFTGPGYLVMAPLAWSTLFVMLQQTASGILQGIGQVWTTARNLLLGVAVKLLLTWWWTGIPALQANGAAYATGVAFGLVAVLNLWALNRHMGLTVNFRGDIAKPLLASLIMGAVIWVISPVVQDLIPGHRIPGLLVIAIGGLVYLGAIFPLGGITEADLGLIPGVTGGLVARLKRYRILRD